MSFEAQKPNMDYNTEQDTLYSRSSGFFSHSQISFGESPEVIFYGNVLVNVIEYTPIGKGNSGDVYCLTTKSESTNNKIACKVIHYYAKNKISVHREIDILKRLKGCDRIITLYGDRILNDQAELYMPYLKEGSLADKLREDTFSDELCLTYSKQILVALCYMHERGVIHRDLKGSNILIESSDHIVVADFGISKIFEENKPNALDIGTYWWMAPEVFNSEKNDGRYSFLADLWSFGCVIIEMKTGTIDKEQIPNQMFKAGKFNTVDYPKDLSKKLKDILDDVLVHHTSRKSAEYVLKKHFQQNNDSMARVHNEEPDWTIFAESDTEHEKAQCQKNPEHLEFIPAEKFEVKNIPLRFGSTICDKKVYKLCKLLKLIIGLTVKIDVKTISTQRCKQWPRTNVAYPYSGFSMGSNQARNGTGFVHLAMFDKEFDECNKSSNGKVCGTVDIISATHVIYDQTEADHTTVTFSVDGVDKELNSFKVVNADVEKNLCVIRSQVYDRDLLYTLHSLLENFESLRKHVYADHSGSYHKDTPVFIVSHPHGGQKQVTMGQVISKKIINKTWSQYKYTAATCPGSSGAYVYVLGESGDVWHYPHVHTGTNDLRQNYSSMGYDTSVDMSEHEIIAANESLHKSECVTVIENSSFPKEFSTIETQTDLVEKEVSAKETQTKYFDEIVVAAETEELTVGFGDENETKLNQSNEFVTIRRKNVSKKKAPESGKYENENVQQPTICSRPITTPRKRKPTFKNHSNTEKITKKTQPRSVLKEKQQNQQKPKFF